MTDNLLFASLQLPQPDSDRISFEIKQLFDKKWIWDSYRETWMLPIMTASGLNDKPSLHQLKPTNLQNGLDFIWTESAPPSVVDYFEANVFSWIAPRPRVVILRTPAGAENREHIDSTLEQVGTRQHKFRLVVSGAVESLYFITTAGHVPAPSTSLPFLIDGSWPHGMKNNSTKEKITICLGAPWTGSSNYPPFEKFVSKENFTRPLDLSKYIPRPGDY